MPSATLTQNSSNQSSTLPTPSASQPALETPPETSLGAAIQILEKKVRNLEKRKSKLDGYRSDSQRGKELNDDQKSAIAKYDEVLQNLDFARELSSAFKTLKDDDDKTRKKALKKELLEKSKMDVQRISQVLETQDILWHINKHRAAKDFLNGGNGACKLTKEQLQHFEDFGKLVGGPSRKLHDPEYAKQLSSTSEHFINLMEGKESKKVGKTNYKELRGLFDTVKSCGYFQTPHEEEERPKKMKNNGIEKQTDKKTDTTNDAVNANNVLEPANIPEQPKAAPEQVAVPLSAPQPAVFLPAENQEEKVVNHQPLPAQGHPRVQQPQQAQPHFPETISFYQQSPVAFEDSQLELVDPAVVKVQHSPPMMNILTSVGPMHVPNNIPSQTFTNPIFIPPTTLAPMQHQQHMIPNYHGFPPAPQLIPQHPPQPTQPQHQTQAPQQQPQVPPQPQEQNHHGNFDFSKDANFERFKPDEGGNSQEQEGNRQQTPPHDTMANIDDWNNGMEPASNNEDGQGKGSGGWRGRGGRGRGGPGRGGPREYRDGGNRPYRGDRERDGNYRGDRDRDRENGNYRGGERDGNYRGGDRDGNYRGGDRDGNYRGGDREGSYRGDRDRGGRGGGDRRGGNRPPRGEGGYRGGNGNGPRGSRPGDSSRGGRSFAPKQNGYEETN